MLCRAAPRHATRHAGAHVRRPRARYISLSPRSISSGGATTRPQPIYARPCAPRRAARARRPRRRRRRRSTAPRRGAARGSAHWARQRALPPGRAVLTRVLQPMRNPMLGSLHCCSCCSIRIERATRHAAWLAGERVPAMVFWLLRFVA